MKSFFIFLFPFLACFLSIIPISFCQPSSHDFIIVGGGTSGCVLASRLCSSLPRANILLLERGPKRDKETDILVRASRLAARAWSHPSLVESFQSDSDESAAGRSFKVITGKTLGGSSSVNGMQWTVPTKGSVPSWDISGLDDTTAPAYFQKAFQQISVRLPQKSQRQEYVNEYIIASKKAGFEQDTDPFNGNSGDSIWQTYLATDANGRRQDSCTAYLTPVIGSCAGLQVEQDAIVESISFSGSRAEAVIYRKGDTTNTAFAKSEILITAGPIGSPALLQRSGIGSNSVLSSVGKVPVSVLPVGESTQARPMFFVPAVYKGRPIEPSNVESKVDSTDSRAQFEAGNGGVLGIASGASNGKIGDTIYTIMGMSFGSPNLINKPIILTVCAASPTSYGALRIRDLDASSSPQIQLNLFKNIDAVNELQDCVTRVQSVYKSFPADFEVQSLVPPEVETSKAAIRAKAEFGYHYVGGCPVGSVLTNKLKVKGVQGLRVIDSSVMSSMPKAAGPMASTYMIAEYVSEKLIKEYSCRFGNGACIMW